MNNPNQYLLREQGFKIKGYNDTKVFNNTLVSTEVQNNIRLFKEWTLKNFYFHSNVVMYLDNVSKVLTTFPIKIEDKLIYAKDAFDTPFSHLLYFAFMLGKNMQVNESKKILDELAGGFTPIVNFTDENEEKENNDASKQ